VSACIVHQGDQDASCCAPGKWISAIVTRDGNKADIKMPVVWRELSPQMTEIERCITHAPYKKLNTTPQTMDELRAVAGGVYAPR